MLILASKSPRRSELLTLAGVEFITDSANGEEILPCDISPSDAVMLLAKQKADEVFSRHPDDIVLAADTVVAADGKILGKPVDEHNASEMLSSLSGKCHSVFTGVCIKSKNMNKLFFEHTLVEFYTLSDNEIKAYIACGEPFDKAGAYGIQGKGGLFVKRIDGDYYNVVGLPIGRVVRELNSNIHLSYE